MRRAMPPDPTCARSASSTSTAASRSARGRSRSPSASPSSRRSGRSRTKMPPRYASGSSVVLLIALGLSCAHEARIQAGDGRLEHLALDLRGFLDEPLKRAGGYDQRPEGRRARHRRRPRHVGDQRDLTEEVARAERVDLLAALGDVGRPLEDDEELAPAIAFAHELLAFGEVDLIGGRGDLFELVLRARLEERHLLDQINFLVAV